MQYKEEHEIDYQNLSVRSTMLNVVVNQRMEGNQTLQAQQKSVVQIAYQTMSYLKIKSDQIQLELSFQDPNIDSWVYSYPVLIFPLLIFFLGNFWILNLKAEIKLENTEVCGAQIVFFQFILLIIKYKIVGEPYFNLLWDITFQSGIQIISLLEPAKLFLICFQGIAFLIMIIIGFLLCLPSMLALTRKEGYTHLVLVGLLFYDASDMSVTLLTLYHLAVALPAQLRMPPLKKETLQNRSIATIFILSYLHYLKLVMENNEPCFPYFFKEIVKIEEPLFSNYFLGMMYFNGGIRELWDRLIDRGIIIRETLTFSRLKNLIQRFKLLNEAGGLSGAEQKNESMSLFNTEENKIVN